MPRELLKKYLPDPNQIKEHKYLSLLGSRLHDPNLWHLHRRSASLACFVGLFCAFIPVPMQMVVAAFIAILLRCNLPISMTLVWITNPLTIPPMLFVAYQIGAWILNYPPLSSFEFSMEWIQTEIANIWVPLLAGALVCGLTSGTLGYLLIRLLWRWHVVRRWEQRRYRGKP
jgi:hypothetical protein